MTTKAKLFLLLAAAAALGACRSHPVLVFGQSHTVGIAIGGAAAEGGAEMTVGYKDRDIAIVPVAIVPDAGTATRDALLVTSAVGAAADTAPDTDALSVLGQFQVSANAKTPDVGLGKFFATGLAAQKLADGFACKLGDPRKCPEQEGAQQAPPVVTQAVAR